MPGARGGRPSVGISPSAVGAKHEIYERISGWTSQGVPIIVILERVAFQKPFQACIDDYLGIDEQ
jgi:hypothetical protein